ncbi:autotransporter outer membrane beta-barrel domain-containing protein, partial [Conservatibacter flavescens]
PTEPTQPTEPTTPIYKETVPGIVAMQRGNLEQGYAEIGSLHQRRGDGATMAWDSCGCVAKESDGQTWIRLLAKRLELDGRYRFDTNMNIYGVQIGHDFNYHYDKEDQSRSHSGLIFGYSRNKMKFYDQYRVDMDHYFSSGEMRIAGDKQTGTGKSDRFSLGLSHTHYEKNGSYLDLVGLVSYIRNTYTPRRDGNQVSQNGLGVVLSAEVGRPWAIGDSNWLIEPQAQLIYQYLNLSSFKADDVTTVKGANHHGLRGRLGVRLAHHSDNGHAFTNTVYGIANIYHDFMDGSSVQIGRDKLSEKYNRTWWEVGVGMQLPLTPNSHIYADARYESNFGGEKRQGYGGTIGYKYTWR